MSPELKMALLTLAISGGVALIGTAGALTANWLDLHGHKQAANIERAVIRALVGAIQDTQHGPTIGAVGQRAAVGGDPGVMSHDAIQAVLNA